MAGNAKSLGRVHLPRSYHLRISRKVYQKIVSGKDVLASYPNPVVTKDSIRIPPGSEVKLEKRPIEVPENAAARRLAQTVDTTKTVLVVQVKVADARSMANAAELSDSVFGTPGNPLGNPVNLASQFDACLFGSCTFIPAGSRVAVG